MLAVLTERYALPFDDARLAIDRVRGGVVRASSGSPANQPDKSNDPLAWVSYRLRRVRDVTGADPGSTLGVRLLSATVARTLAVRHYAD